MNRNVKPWVMPFGVMLALIIMVIAGCVIALVI